MARIVVHSQQVGNKANVIFLSPAAADLSVPTGQSYREN
jgi:hypothetical protein